MKTRAKLFVPVSCLLFSLTWTAFAADSGTGDEQTLRDLDAQWSKAAAAKDLEKGVSFYSDDATVLPANAPVCTTKDAIRKLWGDLLASPGLSMSWKTTKVEIAKSGDLAFLTGTYELTMNDASGKPTTDHGKYVEVWEKKGGTWKCGTDIWNSDLPLPGSPPPEKK